MTLALTPNKELFHNETEATDTKLLPCLKEQLSRQRIIRYTADRDPTTGLLRRPVFFERLGSWLSSNTKRPKPFSLCLFELKDTEELYRRHGVSVVNQLIAVIGSVLTASFGIADLRSRYQATMFAVAFPRMLAAQCSSSVEALLARVSALEFYDETGARFSISCSAGISQYPQDAREIGALCKSTERKLWRASRQGISQLCM
jgi:diguanylate cyclase (GGDEF)-like protein